MRNKQGKSFFALNALMSSMLASTPQSPNGMGSIGAYTCKGLQARLEDFFGRNISMYRTLGDVSFIKWLLSPQNTANFQRINVESVPGKKRPVVFRLEDPYCFELCRTTLDCTTDPVFIDHTTKEVVFDLTSDPFRHCNGSGDPVALRYSDEDLMKYCVDTDQSIIQRDMARYILQFEKALDKALATIMLTLIGHNGKDEAITNIPFWVENQNLGVQAINPNAVWYLQQVYRDMGLDGQFAMLGGVEVNKLTAFNKWINNNEAGVDMSKTGDNLPYMFYDRNFESVLGASDMLMSAPGVVQLVTWNKYKGEKKRQVTDLYTHGTLALPTTGLEVDYEWVFDYKCKIWTFECFLHAELVSVPAGGCGSTSNTNGLIRVHDCSGVATLPVCPTT